jgi:hypothetical protein
MIGPDLLVNMAEQTHIGRLYNVGLFTGEYLTILAYWILHPDQFSCPPAIIQYRQRFGRAMAAANLCHFQRADLTQEQQNVLDSRLLLVVNELVRTSGGIANASESA